MEARHKTCRLTAATACLTRMSGPLPYQGGKEMSLSPQFGNQNQLLYFVLYTISLACSKLSP